MLRAIPRASSRVYWPWRIFSARTRASCFCAMRGFAVDPLHAIGVGEEADLLVDRQHVEPLGHDLADGVGKEVVPPVAGQAQVGQLPGHGAEGLVGVPRRQEDLEPQPRMAADHLRKLVDRPLLKDARRFVGHRLRGQAELKDDLLGVFLQGRQIGLVDVRGIDVALGRAGLSAAADGGLHLGVADQAVVDQRGEQVAVPTSCS